MHYEQLSTTIAPPHHALKNEAAPSFNSLFATLFVCLSFFILSLFSFPAHAALEGKLESATCDEVKGWAWNNAAAPNTRVQVSIFDVNATTHTAIRLITLTAQQPRPDLLTAGIFDDDGKHGFSFLLPAAIRNAVKHTLSVRFAGTTAELISSPKLTPTACFGKLNDTGVINCSNSTNNLTCPVTGFEGQDADYGRDAKKRGGKLKKIGAGIAGFDYTKIANDGTPLPATAVLGKKAKDWACTYDNVTGLMWEVKTNDGGLRDKDNSYTWYNPDYTTNGGDEGTQTYPYCTGVCNSYAYQKAVNAIKLCGKKDWRVPTLDELTSILYLGSYDAIDTVYFPNTERGNYWGYATSSTVVRYNYFIWTVVFRPGDIDKTRKGIRSGFWLVRGGQ